MGMLRIPQWQVLGLVSASLRLTGLGTETDLTVIVICLRKHGSVKMCWVTLFSPMNKESCCLAFDLSSCVWAYGRQATIGMVLS